MDYTQTEAAAARAVVPEISTAAAKNLIETRGALLVDVREPHEIAMGFLAGAHHTPLGQVAACAEIGGPKHDSAYRLDRPIILYCAAGNRSAIAGKMLLDMGFVEVFNLGGARDAARAGFPLTLPQD